MTSDIKDRALRLIEKEDRARERHAEREKEAEKETRVRSAIERIKKQDREITAERARKQAEAEAEEIAAERHALEERMEAEAMALNRSIAELEALNLRHTDALRRAGRKVGHGHSLRALLPTWFKHRFGGFNAITGVPGSPAGGRERTLAERDPLASPRTFSDTQRASS